MASTRKYNIVLFHPEGEEYLKMMVLHGLEYTVFDPLKDVTYSSKHTLQTIPECLKLHFRLLAKSFFSIRHAKNFYHKCRAVYIANQLREIKPKVILTFLDNSSTFHLVCEAYTETPFLAIQNGGRHSWCANEALPDSDLKYHIDEYFCFGPYVKNLFESHKHYIKQYITCGSMLGGYYYSAHKKLRINLEKKYDICLVSQWHANLFENLEALPRQWRRLGAAIDILTEYISRYAAENDLKVCVALRGLGQAEHDYHKKYFGSNCTFLEGERLEFTSYKAADAANLTITINSTLASEAFGAGLKVLFVNPFGEQWLNPTTDIGSWYLPEANYESFSDRIYTLLNMKTDKYLNEAFLEMENVMKYDLDRPAHTVIRDRLVQLVGCAK